MSQELINSITRLTRAIEALAERVTKLEHPPTMPPYGSLNDEIREHMAKRGPGRPRKAAPPYGT